MVFIHFIYQEQDFTYDVAEVLGELDGVTNNYDTYAPGTEGSFIQFVVPEDWDTLMFTMFVMALCL